MLQVRLLAHSVLALCDRAILIALAEWVHLDVTTNEGAEGRVLGADGSIAVDGGEVVPDYAIGRVVEVFGLKDA